MYGNKSMAKAVIAHCTVSASSERNLAAVGNAGVRIIHMSMIPKVMIIDVLQIALTLCMSCALLATKALVTSASASTGTSAKLHKIWIVR